jgi:hypothetical protein
MTDKTLKSKAIKIQDKEYVLVSDRVIYFNDKYPMGSISTRMVYNQNGRVVIRAKVTPDISVPNRYFTGYSQADEKQGFINKTAAIENCETSAVGRAVGMMGIGVLDSIASADEVKKASYALPEPPEMTIGGQTLISVGKCQKCGAEMRISKKGKRYCSALCWQKPIPDKIINEQEGKV